MKSILPKSRFHFFVRFVALLLIFSVALTSVMPLSLAQGLPVGEAGIFFLPPPGARVELSAAFVPSMMKGITIHPENPLQFDFLMSQGDEPLAQADKQKEYER